MIKNLINCSISASEGTKISDFIKNLEMLERDMQKICVDLKIAHEAQVLFYDSNREEKNES